MNISQRIKLDEKTRDRLKALAQKRSRSPHWLMRTAIEDYLDRQEQYEREKDEDMARREQYALTGKAVKDDEAVKWLQDLSKNDYRPWSL